MRYRHASHSISITLLALLSCGLLSSCSTTPQSSLHGRWFNDEMSIRFRTDGTVIFNSTAGLATGRYFFNGEIRPEASTKPVTNLTMDLERNGEVFRVTYEVEFLGKNRLRIQPVDSLQRGLPSDDVAQVVVLKRAGDEPINGVASAG
jgi:hypothetical protein